VSQDPDEGVVFVALLQGDRQIAAAAGGPFNITRILHEYHPLVS
jgi:hypothetical protein